MPNAAPAYIARHGEPPTLADLTAHRAVGYPHGGMSRMKDWEFVEWLVGIFTKNPLLV